MPRCRFWHKADIDPVGVGRASRRAMRSRRKPPRQPRCLPGNHPVLPALTIIGERLPVSYLAGRPCSTEEIRLGFSLLHSLAQPVPCTPDWFCLRSAWRDNSDEGCAAVCAMASENRANVIMQASRCRIVNSMQLKCIAVQSREMHYGWPLTRREVFGVLALGPIRTTACIAVEYECWTRPHAELTASIQKSGRSNDGGEPPCTLKGATAIRIF